VSNRRGCYAIAVGWKSWKYKNITTLASAFVVAFFLGSYDPFQNLVYFFGYSAAFLAGVIFISTFTAPIAAAILLILAQRFPLPELWLFASLGAVTSDFFFFKVVKDGLAAEIEPIYEDLVGNSFHKIVKTKHFRWLFPVIGTLILVSPFPKEQGIDLLGIPKLTTRQFVLLSTLINLLGIAFILLLSFVIKP